ncbi:MAG TPA: hypothetical protein VKZ68_06785 [Ohtaekwangia sp.]|nr:hypothetical protein [Ohtaekwangia sp.]
MAYYFVNKDAQKNGDHEVHKDNCEWMPVNRLFLGNYFDCEDAIREAKKTYDQVNGCIFCCKACHTS